MSGDYMHREELGFTLIEMLVSMTIALVLLAGLYSNFIMQSKVQNAQSQVVSVAEDLRAASHVMEEELRGALTASIDTSVADEITYNTLNDPYSGVFRYVPASNRVCWIRPEVGGSCNELVRDLDGTNGMIIANASGVITVTLVSQYKDQNNNDKNWQVSFAVWPRN